MVRQRKPVTSPPVPALLFGVIGSSVFVSMGIAIVAARSGWPRVAGVFVVVFFGLCVASGLYWLSMRLRGRV